MTLLPPSLRAATSLVGWALLACAIGDPAFALDRSDRPIGIQLRASQVGYPVSGSKLAVALGTEPLPERFEVVGLETARPVFEGPTRPATGTGWGRFSQVAELDFSRLRQPGRFRLRLGGAVSVPFRVNDTVFRPLPDLLIEFLRQQRCGDNPWLDAQCHQLDGRTAYGPLPAGSALDARGGWHDAADLLKYLLTSGNATAQMLLAWQLDRDRRAQASSPLFDDQFDALGRARANGLPDVLDEARWGLEFYPFLNAGHFRLHGVVDAEFQRRLEGWYREGIERCRADGEENPLGIGVPFVWCSNNLVVALITQCALYERMSGDARYREFAARHRDWLLGRNPWGVTQFMGVGVVSPQNVHLMTTRLTKRVLRGGLVDGPVYERIFKSLKGVSITEPDPLADFQDVRAVYHDDLQDYAGNEPTMDGTASAVLMWTVLQP